ncbi:MAG: hypothetical protein M8353_10610 [ANME-2 cluster archaeon]|nr:hypothetical protein [ANME-2 cluster archaeon]
MNNNDLITRFQTISYLFGGIVFSLLGLSGLKQMAYIQDYPGTSLIVFTALLTSFGIWSLRKFYRQYRTMG